MKKIILLFLIIFSVTNVKALKLVSIGDSIPNGYLLDNENDSYDNLFAKELNLDFYEYSYIGMTTKNILNDLDKEEVKENIKDADIIFLSVGSNDLLDLITESDYNFIDVNYFKDAKLNLNYFGDNYADVINNICNTIISDLETKIPAVYNDFKSNWTKIINKIKSYNKSAKIYVNNIYNPYFNIKVPIKDINLTNIIDFFDKTIVFFNEIIENNNNYEIIDVYHLLRKNKFLNINILQNNFDPHPNQKGHQKLYEEYLDKLCYKVTYQDKIYYVIKGEKFEIKPAYKPLHHFKKWNHDINHITSDITLKEIYVLNYKILYYIIPPIFLIIIIFIKIKNRH